MLKKPIKSILNVFKLSISRNSTNTNLKPQADTTESTNTTNSKELSIEDKLNNPPVSISKEELTKIYKNSKVGENVEYFEKLTKHRPIYNLYEFCPNFDNCFVAPNATILGEVIIDDFVSIWFNCVVRGDINKVTIGELTTIGDHTVISTVNSLPTGLPAVVYIGQNCIIQNKCSLVSCVLEDRAFIGHGSVVLEGSRVESGAVVLANSVVPPGRIIPSNQIWGGNPVRYIRDIKPGEVFSNYTNTYQFWNIAEKHKNTYDPFNYAYLEQESFKDDIDLSPEMMEIAIGNKNMDAQYRILAEDKNYLL